jgi:zinc transport system substrate-binding protein
VSAKLSQLDPNQKAVYQRNLELFIADVETTVTQVRQVIEPVKRLNYVVFHDAYQYFENYFGLQNASAISISPERKPGAKKVAEIRAQIEQQNIQCIFSEPQFNPGIVTALTVDSEVKVSQLDPIGAQLSDKNASYTDFLKAFAKQFQACL